MVPAPPSDAGGQTEVSGRPTHSEQSRARYPDTTGFIERDGVNVFYEVYGSGEPAILFLPTWSIVHSRIWKLQVPDLARQYRVITFDPRGNGRSGRPTNVDAYAETEYAADALAVLDATSTHRAIIVSLSIGAHRALILASDHPERVAGAVFIGPALPLGSSIPGREPVRRFGERLDTDAGWAKYNSHYWRQDYRGFLEFFFGECFSEAHSTKPTEDAVGWGEETNPGSLILSHLADGLPHREAVLERCAGVRCPVLVIHGADDRLQSQANGEELARATSGRFVGIDAGGHIPNVREPVLVNLLIRDFVRRIGARR